jgi:hypothetical protein
MIMKYSIVKVSLLLITILGFSAAALAQNKDPAAVTAMVESKNFVFKAQFANPQSGRNRPLTSSYDLTVRPDSILSFLPYFGRAYSAPVNTSDAGIKFTSTDFGYTTEKRKKQRWDIAIKPQDVTGVQALNLTVFDNGNATLRVTSLNRQPISFNGYITEGRPLNKKAF